MVLCVVNRAGRSGKGETQQEKRASERYGSTNTTCSKYFPVFKNVSKKSFILFCFLNRLLQGINTNKKAMYPFFIFNFVEFDFRTRYLQAKG